MSKQSNEARVIVVGEPSESHQILLQNVDWEWSPAEEVSRRLVEARLTGRPFTALALCDDVADDQLAHWRGSPLRQGMSLLVIESSGLLVDFEGNAAHALLPALLSLTAGFGQPAPESLRVLVVDDVPVNRRFLEGHLSRLGHQAFSAESADDAQRRLREERFDLVLMDVEMPGRDGLDVTRSLRHEWGPNQDTPVLGASGHSGEATRQRCLESGMQDLLVKPVNRLDLQAALRQWGGRRILITPSRNRPSVDARNLLEVTQGDAEILAEVIAVFSEDLVGCLSSLAAFLRDDDRKGFQVCARTLGGAAATLGARHLEAIAGDAAEADWPEHAAQALVELYEESRRVEEFLKSGLVEPEMVEVEFTTPSQLDQTQAHLVDLHSFLNILNVIASELFFLGQDLGSENALQPCLTMFEGFAAELRQPSELALGLARTEEVLSEFWIRFEQGTARAAAERVQASAANLRSIFGVLQRRVEELRQRVANPDLWVAHDVAALRESLHQMFSAVEKNSKGRYHIVFNVAAKEEQDYLIHLDLSSVDGATLTMPPVLQDVFRDLLANARKYTDPGGTILGGLVDDGHHLRLVVADDGRGIPADEISRVVEMGYRAANVADRPTMGGGFGLTKAHWVASRLGGTMKIRSGLRRGTRIEVAVPRREVQSQT